MATNNSINNIGNIIGTFFLAPNMGGTQVATAFCSTNNQVNLIQFTLPSAITINKISFVVTGASSGKYASVGIYDSDDASLALLVDSGPISTTATGTKTKTLGSPVTLKAGNYFLASTSNSNVPTGLSCVASNFYYFLNVTGGMTPTFKIGTAVAGSSGGQLPNALGGVNSNARNPVMAYLSTE